MGMVGLLLLLVLGALAVQWLAGALVLWLAARLCGVRQATFGRAFVTAVYITLALLIIEAGLWFVVGMTDGFVSADGRSLRLGVGEGAGLSLTSNLASVLALAGGLVVQISFIASGFRVGFGRAVLIALAQTVVLLGLLLGVILLFGALVAALWLAG